MNAIVEQSAQTPAARASITDLVTKERTNPEAVERGYKLIFRSIKESANWTRELFILIRSCEDVSEAKGSLVAAESRAIIEFRKIVQLEDPNYSAKIKTLADIAKYNGDKQLTYSVTKSKLLSIIDNETDLCSSMQGWWNFQAKHDKEPQKALPEGFLNIYSKRYSDEKKGSTLFMRDAREAQASEGMLVARTAQLNRELSKDAAAKTGQNGDQTQQGIASGTRMRDVLPESTQQCLNALVKAVHDQFETVELEWLNGVLSNTVMTINAKAKDVREEHQRKAAETHKKRVEAEPSQALVKPEWMDAVDWEASTEQERAQLISDGPESYKEEQELMRQAEGLGDTGSNEPLKPAEARQA